MDGGLSRRLRLSLHAGWLAGVCFGVAVLVLAADHSGFVAARHPLGHLGALQASGALLWNLLGFILPGLLLMSFSIALEIVMQRDGVSRIGRIGTGMLMLSALAFAAQGVLPFDLDDPHVRASQLHVSALVLALLGLMAGAFFVAFSLKARRGWRVLTGGGAVLAILLLVLLIWPPQDLIPGFSTRPGHAQRLIFALYFGWFALAAGACLRRAWRLAQTQPVA